MRSIRSIAICFLLFATTSASATTSLDFYSGDYDIFMVIGHDTGPVIASITVQTPRAPKGVDLPYGSFESKIVEGKERFLWIRFVQLEQGKEPSSFTLTVRGDEATLLIDNKVIESRFSWEQ